MGAIKNTYSKRMFVRCSRWATRVFIAQNEYVFKIEGLTFRFALRAARRNKRQYIYFKF